MNRPVLALATGAAIAVPAAAAPDLGQAKPVARWRCPKRFTVQMGERAARAIYRGTRRPHRRGLKLLGRIEMCQRNPAARDYMRSFDHRQAEANQTRRLAAAEPPGMYGEWAIPGYIVQCESGGTNEPPGADGNSTTASGYYQILDSTWAEYGGQRYGVSEAFEASKVAQDWIAHQIWDSVGPSAWSCA